MKKALPTLCSIFLSCTIFAQNPPVSGYKLWLDASSTANFVAGNSTTPSLWKDLSGNNNHVRSLLTTGTNPLLLTYQGYKAIQFTGSSVLQNDTLNNSFGDTSATVFVVTNLNNTMASISIAEDQNVNNEFVIENNNVFHHSAASNWIGKNIQCTPTIDSSIIVIAGAWGKSSSANGTNSFINNVKSNTPTSIGGAVNGQYGTPTDYLSENRRINVGGRIQNGHIYSGHQYNGYIFEVIAYNRLLSNYEIAQVNTFLKQKYAINYSTCNALGLDNLTSPDFSISPNPVQSTLTISMGEHSNIIKTIKVYDISGRQVLSNFTSTENINVSGLSNGSYVIAIETEDNVTLTKHFIKQD